MKKEFLILGLFLFLAAPLLGLELADPETNDTHLSQTLHYSTDKDCKSATSTDTDSVAITDFSYDSDDEYSSETYSDSSEYEPEDVDNGNISPQIQPNNASPAIINILSELMHIANLAYTIPNQNHQNSASKK